MRIGADGLIKLATTYDYTVGGGYVFSDLVLFHGPYDASLTIDPVVLSGEYVHDIDLAVDADNSPLFAVAQQFYGGHFGSLLVYWDGFNWKERNLRSGWAYRVNPIQIAVGTAIHVNSCGKYTKSADPAAAVTWVSSWVGDMVIDTQDTPYFIAASGRNVTLDGLTAAGSRVSLPIAIESGTSPCEASPCTSFTAGRILYNRGQILGAYLGDDYQLRVRGYPSNDLRCYFSASAALTVSKVGTGAGTVITAPAGTACGELASSYPGGALATLRAVPSVEARFVGWSGDCAGKGTICSVALEAGSPSVSYGEFRVVSANALRLEAPSGAMRQSERQYPSATFIGWSITPGFPNQGCG